MEVRAATIEDAREIALLDEAPEDEAESLWRARIARAGAGTDGLRIWVQGTQVAGFAFTRPTEDRDLEPLEVAELAALRVAHGPVGEIVGAALLERAVAGMRAQGFLQATTWVVEDDTDSIRFYEENGWRREAMGPASSKLPGGSAHRYRFPL